MTGDRGDHHVVGDIANCADKVEAVVVLADSVSLQKRKIFLNPSPAEGEQKG